MRQAGEKPIEAPTRMQTRFSNFASGSILIRAATLCVLCFGFLLQGTTTIVARSLPAGAPATLGPPTEPPPPVGPEVSQPEVSLAVPPVPATATGSPLPAATSTRAMDVSLAALLPIPTPTAPTPAPTAVPAASNPHGDFGAITASCAGCHRAHTGSGLVLRRDWPEENTCFGCHAEGGAGVDVQLAFTSNINTDTAFFKHDVALTNGVHRTGQSAGSDFGGSNRHVECEDCHEPHEASRGPAEAPMLPREMARVSGVDPVWSDVGAPVAFTWLPQAEREYQVCFKCHSSFTTLPTYLPDGWNGSSFVANGLPKLTSAAPSQITDSRDMAREFNPFNASFHPVAAPGRNQSIPPGSFVAGWSQSSLVYCRDCHTNPDGATQGHGPHGSARLHLLAGQADYTTVYGGNYRMSDQELCFNCHNYETYVTGQNSDTNFYAHPNHLNRNWGVTCYTCHDSHGSEQLHLLNLDSTAAVFLNGRNSQSAWYVEPTGQAGCYLTCHNRQHDNLSYWTNVTTSTPGDVKDSAPVLKSSSKYYLPIILK